MRQLDVRDDGAVTSWRIGRNEVVRYQYVVSWI